MCRECETLVHSFLKGMSPSIPSPNISGNCVEEEAERLEEPEGMERIQSVFQTQKE